MGHIQAAIVVVMPYSIPVNAIAPHILAKLDNREGLNRTERQHLIIAIVDDLFVARDFHLPTHGFGVVAHDLLMRWPHLRLDEGSAESWAMFLKNCSRNRRRRFR